MNIEIANRLVNLRKSNNLSQEALAEKLGISRQAVSKWERAEASPDTDNLILLARLYGVSLDELLKTEDEIPLPEPDDNEETGRSEDTDRKENGFGEFGKEERESWSGGYDSDEKEYVNIGLNGVHVKDRNSEVHVGWDGVHVDDYKKGENVHINKDGVYVNGKKYDKDWHHEHHHVYFPIGLLISVVYLIIGCVWNAWHPGWILFLLIPLWYSLIETVEKKNANHFAYPILATLGFLVLGFFFGAWHPGWVLFVTIPVYYSLVNYIHYVRRRNGREERYYDQDNTEKEYANEEE